MVNYPDVKYVNEIWLSAMHLRMNIINAILLITGHHESKYGFYTDAVIEKAALNPRTVMTVDGDGDTLDYIIYGLNERLKGTLPAQVIDDLIYGEIDSEEARKRCSEYPGGFEPNVEDLKESTRMGLKEAKKILEAKGCRLLKEYNGAMSILIRTINKILANNNINGTVEEIELNTKIKPLGALAVTVEGAEKPYIIGYAENMGTTELGEYIVFTCDNKDSTRVRPVMHNCYSRAETYNCIIEKVKDHIQALGV
jgi:hypothetical protein